ncbi:MAG: BMC domain-containing protein [Elusimicrobiota bacterium]|jgi:microcompartment protein CcmL/EutN|nr:BMC domain-containing protein [Elusimicrobiota bacterium]
MKKALGLVEFKTIPAAVYAVDEMLKASEIELVFAAPICPGKYIAIVSGEVANVGTSVKRAVEVGDTFLISSYVIPNISETVMPAITGTLLGAEDIEALGLVETIAAVSAVKVGDIVAKAANVRLLEIRLARGLGGKGEVFFTGKLGDVEAAEKAAKNEMAEDGGIVSSVVIARPSKALIEAIN